MNIDEYTLRDALLSMIDPSNWDDEMTGEWRKGYAEAMEYLHEVVMEFWDVAGTKTLVIDKEHQKTLIEDIGKKIQLAVDACVKEALACREEF